VKPLVVFLAAFVAGAINSVAGGGTLVSFPALIWMGLPSIVANATSASAIWPGSLGSIVGYRRELRELPRQAYLLVVPSLVGGILGAVLLRLTPSRVFDRLVPLLILFATVLFMAQEPVQRFFRQRTASRDGASSNGTSSWMIGALTFQLLVAMYGGYFGAGMGIMMLAALGILGYTDIHQMNGLKTLLALAINGAASFYFIWQGMVSWPEAGIMAVGAIVGGYWGAGIARRIGPKGVRRIVVAIGFGMGLSLLFRR
jgi:uncharacterized membrane protein YfcA